MAAEAKFLILQRRYVASLGQLLVAIYLYGPGRRPVQPARSWIVVLVLDPYGALLDAGGLRARTLRHVQLQLCREA